jgi:signal peptidase II
MKRLLVIALPIFALDQATKWWILGRSGGVIGWQETIIPDFFDLCYLANTGAAFSSFGGRNSLFIVISFVALIAIIIGTLRGVFRDALSRTAIGLLLGGILGNLTDRITHGHVVDFLLFDLHVRFANPWPAFNVADSAICIAAGLFILTSFFAPRSATPKVGSANSG